MDNQELRTLMESELLWRKEEYYFFKNQLNNFASDEDKNRYRKCLVLILYSHLEGFVKICLLTYIQYINSLGLQRKKVNRNLAASSMEQEFKAYDNNDIKCTIFKKALPEDKRLHRLYRRVHLLDSLKEFDEASLFITDDAINTESNLWYIVIQKNLYKSGLPVDLFEAYKGDIDGLVNKRNSFAHGAQKGGMDELPYNNWEKSIFYVMEGIVSSIYDFALNSKYLR